MVGNPSNLCLQTFEERYRLVRAIKADNAVTPKLRKRLLNALLKLPSVGDFEGRNALILGIPLLALTRSATNGSVDLAHIIDGLSKVGQLESGDWPLLLLIENALITVDHSYDLGQELKQIGSLLATAYAVEWNS